MANELRDPLRPGINDSKESSGDMAKKMGLNDLKDYKDIDDPSNELSDKYKGMVQTRSKYGEDDIDITKGLPNLQEMFTDDLAYEFYKDLIGGEATPSADKEVLDAVFYSQDPPSTLGYSKDNTFTLDYTGKISKSDLSKALALNKFDGDTFSFNLDQFNDGGKSFTMNNGQSYDSFAHYCKENNLDTSTLTIRGLGIDAQEIPHMEVQAMLKSEIITMTLDEANKKGALIKKYNYDNGTVTERKGSDTAQFYKIGDKYTEIIEDGKKYMSSGDTSNLKPGYEYKVVLTKDDSTKEGLADGYKAQKELLDLLSRSKQIKLKVDANGLKANKTTGVAKTYYNHWWHVFDAISGMVDQWQLAMDGTTPLSRLSFDPFGTDGYGRFLGEIYCLVNMNGEDVWINANKYVLCKTDATVSNPENSDKYGSNSKSFELWEYDRNNFEYLDAFMNQTAENYRKRIELHKEVTGIDFEVFRNCTLMLGDTLFLIPPTSIRNVSSVEYEKASILRGKGSMVKNLTNREQFLEIDLYFYDDPGINGLEYVYTFPNGKQMTYFLDGFRSLIAQFHLAPYLPIENQYINDVLNIEAVSLVNFNMRTVEGYPRLLQATLTLRDFNYRIFMPDVPIDYASEEVGVIAEMNPIFAKCIHWEVFRYYYQRLLSRGNELVNYNYGTKEYFDKVYSNNIILRPTGFCDFSDEISFYVPDENWLSAALEVKQARDYYGQDPKEIVLTDNAQAFLTSLGNLAPYLALNNDIISDIKNNCLIADFGLTTYKNKDVFNSTILNTLLKPKDTGSSTSGKEYLHKLLDPITELDQHSEYLKYERTDESYDSNTKTITWDVIFDLKTGKLTSSELIDIKEVLKDLTGGSNVKGILDEGQLIVSVSAKTNEGNILDITSAQSQKSIIEDLGEQYGTSSSPNTETQDGATPNIDTNGIFTDKGVSDNIFAGYKKLTVDGGDLTGTRQPNAVVDIGFGDREYWGFTNEYGQLVKVVAKEIKIQDDSKEPVTNGRYYPDEAKVPGTERSDLDEGHVIADSLGGVSNAYNITPQNSTLNRTGSQAKMEEEIREAGGCTDFVAIMTYPDTKTQIPSNYSYSYNLNGQKKNLSFKNSDEVPGYDGDDGTGSNDRNNTVVNEYDYRDPAAMQFIPWLERVPLHSLACGMSNHFTEMSLKIMDGSAPQYMGSSDISIELRIITEDATTVSMLNVLPTHAMNIAKQYRKILNCWPMRVECTYLQLMGINEVLIDSIQIENMEGFPGVYDIRVRMTSVDRFMRQREMLKKLDSKQDTVPDPASEISSYFDIEDTLAWAETYPDLDLPSLSELSQLGYKFIKYNNSKNVYPDPDFYMLYGYEYTAKIIKKNIKDVYLTGLLHSDKNNNEADVDKSGRPFMYMMDQSGQVIATNLTSTKGLEITGMNDVAEMFTKAMNDAAKIGDEDIKKKERKGEDKEYDETVATTGKALIQLTLADVQEGWELKPGWVATMAPLSTNLAIENCEDSNIAETENEDKTDIYAKEIFDLRKQAIELIDKILSEPANFGDIWGADKVHSNWYIEAIVNPIKEATTAIFKDNENGAKLLKLLCPYGDVKDADGFAWNQHDDFFKQLKKPKALNYIQHFLHAAACTLSGEEPKRGKTGFLQSGNEYEDYGARQYVNINKEWIPYCLCENAGKPATQAKTLEQAEEHGFIFGMCQISKETKASILKRLEPTSQVDYLGGGKTFEIYKKYKDGFLDPYYNKLDKNSSELKEYIHKIAISPYSNCLAFVRIVLMYLRKQIIDGYLISEVDLIGSDSEFMKEMFTDTDRTWDERWQAAKDVDFTDSFKSGFDMNMDGTISGTEVLGNILSLGIQGSINGIIRYNENVDRKIDANEIEDKTDGELDGEFMQELLEGMEESYAKSYCARWIYPFLEAATQTAAGPNAAVHDLLSNRKFEQLNLMSTSLLSTDSTSYELITKFLLITQESLTNVTEENMEPGTTSNAQKLMNTIAREAFTKLSEDPQAYILHSFYDMLVNDKRGRLLRAFPTYYVVFIDEGRRIGSWKLFDNFYNMSAISDLTVTKSRKIPADTCSFTMTNMFGSYASEYDSSSKQAYVDVYSLRDVFTSIFSPNAYVLKEDALARRKELGDTTVLQPGVRLHIRMGYGSNAGRLPVVFNGKIAEIDVGDTVTVIGQGDGAELTNPLNALGEISATNIIEAQGTTTICKDLRGSLVRGGLSPRNLLSQILTAQHGGVWKTVIRNFFDNRYYGDNPFGIYHFGDKRFNKIFSEGEVVQNIYEVVDGTLLSGTNELYAKKETTMATPTINTTIQDKTFWDLLTMCAYSGVGYIGAVRDFGFRSTVCLCKPNHYYAYAYDIMDGKYIEKRKPFQQFHYYDSYTDIIFNSIKASGKNIKTNAIGVWEGTDMWWGKEQKTCGPMYVDINIYPEHQKSMTVDTGLVASGNGGIDIPFFTHFSEEWNLNAEADKVNKSLAERITGNTLRETMMNMYQGEICVIGDPSVKPYDRIYLSDTYESMSGQMEVEAVVYSMNFDTGFTTTVYPDLIVRMDDPLEPSVQVIIGNVIAGALVSVTGRLAIIQKLASVDTKVLKAAAQFVKPLIKKVGETRAIQMLANTGMGKALGLKTASAGKGFKGVVEMLKMSGGNIYAIIAMVVIATTVFCLTKNAKSFLTRWIRNIQMLDVYPIFKDNRPFIAGMNGHKGSVVGYEYTEEDCEDSMQGMIVKVVESISDWGWGLGKYLISPFLEHEEYQKTVLNWSNTLKHLETDFEVEDTTQVEGMIQNTYGAVSKEFGARSNATRMLRTKYRVLKFDTNGGKDSTYLKYRNLGVAVDKNIEPTLISGTEGSATAIHSSSLFTNPNILNLYPVEDDPEVKEAILKSHPNKVNFSLAHSKGNKKDNISFESGSRVIRYFVEENPSEQLKDYPVLDLPMIQEDAMVVLKYILNDENLKNKDVVFMSGARINDTRSWKNTGFAFELQCKDSKALEKAVKSVKEKTYWLYNGEEQPMFNYQMTDDICVITIYPEANPLK